MLGKATTVHVHHTYFVHFLVMLHDCNLKMPNFKFYRFFLPLNVVPKLILEKFAHIWRVQWIGINATKFKKGEFILKVTFLLPSPSSMLKLPNIIPSNPTPPYHFWGRGRGDRRRERETRGDRSTIYSPLTPMEGLILRATPPFSDFSVKINYYFQIDNGCLIWEIINPSASNIFLFYLRHFHPRPTHIPLNSPSATGFSDLYGGVCKRGAGVWVGGGLLGTIIHVYLYSYFRKGCRKICALDNPER